MVEIAWDIFRNLADYRLRHLVKDVAIHIYAHDYIKMEITVLYLKISRLNCRFDGRKYPCTNSAIASPVISICDHQISNDWCREIFKYNTVIS
jgi:hypothetical protein